MPLPAALQARLQKRGILQTENKQVQEEVFAENYDEPNEFGESNYIGEENKGEFDVQIANCPNRSNPFHECTVYCKKRYGVKTFSPHPVMEKRRIRMLKIYPLPANWKEVPDLNTNRYYYWNTETNQVCWHSPSYPKAKIEYVKTKPASGPDSGKSRHSHVMQESIDEIDELLSMHEQEARKPSQKGKAPSHHKGSNPTQHKKNKRDRDGEVDPMDPSSYSDIPRGKWSAGLDKND